MGKKNKKVKIAPVVEDLPESDDFQEDEKVEENEPAQEVQPLNFHEMELDDRLLKVKLLF